MLRITRDDAPNSLSLKLEGRLAGPWVRELEDCWQAARAGQRQRTARVDLSAVTYVDGPGKDLLAVMHSQGAELMAAGCLMKAIVAEINHVPFSDFGAIQR